jgi:hypothetical protein
VKAVFREFVSNQIGVALNSTRDIDPASNLPCDQHTSLCLVLVAYTNICFDRALVTTVKRARMLCRPGAMCRRVLSDDLSLLAGIGRRRISRCVRNCAVTV